MGAGSSRGAKRVSPAPPAEAPKIAPPAPAALTVVVPPASSEPAANGSLKVEASPKASKSPTSTSRENSGSWSSNKREKRPSGRLSFAPEPGDEDSDSFKKRSISFGDDESDSFQRRRTLPNGGGRSVTPKRVSHDDAQPSGSTPKREARPSGRLTFAEPTESAPDSQGGDGGTTPRKQRTLSRGVSWANEPPRTNGGGGSGLSRADSFRSNASFKSEASNDSFKSSKTFDSFKSSGSTMMLDRIYGRQAVRECVEIAALDPRRKRRALGFAQQPARDIVDAEAAANAPARQLGLVAQEVAIAAEHAPI